MRSEKRTAQSEHKSKAQDGGKTVKEKPQRKG